MAPYLFLHLEPRYLLAASFAYLIVVALGFDLTVERVASRRRRTLVPSVA
jgi:hypothetical protein